MKKQAEEEFEIFENSWSNSLFSKYPTRNLLRIGLASIGYSASAIKLLDAKLGDEILIAKRADNWYISKLPFDSRMSGWRLFGGKGIVLYSAIPKKLKGFLPVEEYELVTEPEYIKGIDWYQIMLFTPQNDTLIK